MWAYFLCRFKSRLACLIASASPRSKVLYFFFVPDDETLHGRAGRADRARTQKQSEKVRASETVRAALGSNHIFLPLGAPEWLLGNFLVALVFSLSLSLSLSLFLSFSISLSRSSNQQRTLIMCVYVRVCYSLMKSSVQNVAQSIKQRDRLGLWWFEGFNLQPSKQKIESKTWKKKTEVENGKSLFAGEKRQIAFDVNWWWRYKRLVLWK